MMDEEKAKETIDRILAIIKESPIRNNPLDVILSIKAQVDKCFEAQKGKA